MQMKKILITAGPTWVAIDPVRIISNISSGQTGALLANKARKLDFAVTLFLGPVLDSFELDRKIKVVRFTYFDELKDKLTRILNDEKFDIIIHAAAISDYEPIEKQRHKIPSNLDYLNLKLQKTPKLIPLIRKLAEKSFFVMFKLEDKVNSYYIDKTKKIMLSFCVNLAVLNSLNPYRARIIDRFKVSPLLKTKEELVESLFGLIKGLIK